MNRVLKWLKRIWSKITKQKIIIVTVAAFDSSDKDKKIADYICDGVADEIEIQHALDYVRDMGGGTVLIKGGNYNPDNPLNLSGNVKLKGELKHVS